MRLEKHRLALAMIFASAGAFASGDANEPARALPLRVVICVDRKESRCWTATNDADCRSAGSGEVFRVLERGDGSVAHGPALAECWRSVGKEPAE